jgi:hypothetical protein
MHLWPRLPPDRAVAVSPGTGQAGARSFPQNLPFEVSENGEQASHRATRRRRQIQRLSQRHEPQAKIFVSFRQGCVGVVGYL